MIFDMYAKGSTITEIVDDLNSKGLRTLRGGKFTKNSLHSLLKNEKYIGVYTYKDQVRIEGGVPAIISVEQFAKVQEMLKVNKRAPAHTWSRADYLLTEKLFCGHCGAKMVGESGTSKTGAKHNYYICVKRKRERACDKKAIRQEWIESKVITAVIDILNDDEMLNFIADAVWECYQKQNNNIEYVDSLNGQLAEIDKAQANIMKAIEAGLFSSATKKRMEELDAQRDEIEAELSGIELTKSLRMSRDYIKFYLNDFKQGDTKSPVFQKRLVDTFVNSVFVYDDGRPPLLTLNYSGDSRTITLADTDSINADGEKFVCRAECSTKATACKQAVAFLSLYRKVDFAFKKPKIYFCFRQNKTAV